MTYTAKVAVYSEIRTKPSTQSEHYVEFLSIKPDLRKDNTRLYNVNAVHTIVAGNVLTQQRSGLNNMKGICMDTLLGTYKKLVRICRHPILFLFREIWNTKQTEILNGERNDLQA